MKIRKTSVPKLNKIGVYQIKNLINNKLYIGSTKKSFQSRFKSHFERLRTNNHLAYRHLQSSVNKYGIENFEFSVLEICDIKTVIKREKYWINYKKSYIRDFGYNINRNPDESPMHSQETKDRVSEIIKKKYALGIMKPNKTVFKKGIVPWNTGKKYKSTKHLCVPKTITQKVLDKRKRWSEKLRNDAPKIEVYDSNYKLLGCWKSSIDLQEWSLTDSNNLPIGGRFKCERMGKPIKLLMSCNINKACKTNKPYKGLYFKYKRVPKK